MEIMSTEASAPAEGLAPGGPVDSTEAHNPVTSTEENTSERQPEQRTFTQAELDEKIQKRVAKEARKTESRYQELQREIEALKTPKAAESSNPEKVPARGDFDSYEDFVEAKALHTARTEARKELDAFKNESKREREESSRAKSQNEFKARVDSVIEAGQTAYPDFDATINEAVEDGLIPVKGPMYEALMDSDMGHKLAYHLAKHPAEAERIQKLSVYAQLRELGKLEDKLSAKKEQRETMEPIGGRTSTTSGLRDDAPMADWVKARNKQASSR